MLISSIRSFRDVSLKSFPSSSYSPEKKDSASIEYSLAMSVMELILKAFQQGHSQFLFLSFLQQKSLKFQFLYSSHTNQMQYISHNWFLTSGVYMSNNTCGSSKQSEQERKNKQTDKKQTSEDLSELVPALKLLRITKFSGMIILKRQGSVLQTRPQIRRNAVNSMSRKHFLP